MSKWVLELETTFELGDLRVMLDKTTRALTYNGAILHPQLEWFMVDDVGNYHPYDVRTGRVGDSLLDRSTANAAANKFLIDVADIPGHPPMYLPGAEIPLPRHAIHDIRECLWCMEHPVMKARAL